MRDQVIDVVLGCGLAVCFALVALFLIPAYIPVPGSGISAVSPTFWPTVVSWGVAALGVVLAAQGVLAGRTAGDGGDGAADPSRPGLELNRVGVLRVLIAFAAMVGFYFLMPILGIVAAAVPVFVGLAFMIDRTRWRAILIVGLVLPVALYLFFTKGANVPLPLGLFS